MAINEVVFPTVPDPVSGDWAKAIELIEKAMQNINNPLQVDGNNIPQGSTFQVGGHMYYADGDTAISGTPSDYVKLTASGTILVPSFVANLSGVSWNKIWNGYYDSSDDYYIFDEAQALIDTELSTIYSKFGELFEKWIGQALKPTDNPIFNNGTFNNLDIDGELTIGGELIIDNLPVPTYGAIGAIVICTSNNFSINTEYLPNTTVNGNTLYRSTITGGSGEAPLNASTSANYISSSAWVSLGFTGIWRLLTRVHKGSTSTRYPSCLFQRIS